ncbi:hypothetical protein EYF80_047841 [Liparis tanakae]|uniref:Uncharacterized protein n=1 Tax=Liparis tanakae TaxID=230148 RepID=A0A4Z2FME9_9TELE|nr:hypothetical protein EYF80_047841 [Liparis tanakae]
MKPESPPGGQEARTFPQARQWCLLLVKLGASASGTQAGCRLPSSSPSSLLRSGGPAAASVSPGYGGGSDSSP